MQVSETGMATFKQLLTSKIQETACKTYLYTFGAQYDSLSLVQLAAMFGIE
eukprot:COSAG01_NODE_31903_length_589_cov_2.438776_1_plen_50_part_10